MCLPLDFAGNDTLVVRALLRYFVLRLPVTRAIARNGAQVVVPGLQQKVTVEHVHVYEGGQAIVGSVTGGGK